MCLGHSAGQPRPLPSSPVSLDSEAPQARDALVSGPRNSSPFRVIRHIVVGRSPSRCTTIGRRDRGPTSRSVLPPSLLSAVHHSRPFYSHWSYLEAHLEPCTEFAEGGLWAGQPLWSPRSSRLPWAVRVPCPSAAKSSGCASARFLVSLLSLEGKQACACHVPLRVPFTSNRALPRARKRATLLRLHDTIQTHVLHNLFCSFPRTHLQTVRVGRRRCCTLGAQSFLPVVTTTRPADTFLLLVPCEPRSHS